MSPFRRLGEWLGIVEPEDEPDEFSFVDDRVDDLAGFEPTPPRPLVRSGASASSTERRYDVRAEPTRSGAAATASARSAPATAPTPTTPTRPATAPRPTTAARAAAPTTAARSAPTAPARPAAASSATAAAPAQPRPPVTPAAAPRSWARADQRWAEVDLDSDPAGDLAGDLRYDGGAYDDGRYGDARYDDGRYDDGRYDDGRYGDGRYDDGFDDPAELLPSLEPAPAPRPRPVSRPGPDGTIPFPARPEPARPGSARPTAAPAATGSGATGSAATGSAATGSAATGSGATSSATTGSAAAGSGGESLTLAPSAIRERALVGDEKRQITALAPTSYAQARDIGVHFREGHPVIMNLTEMAEADAKRLVDFAAGLAFGLRGSMERVTNRVFLLSPANVSVSAEERRRIAEGGYRPAGE